MGRPNQIYIIPTARGLIFLGAAAVMVLTAATYNNNLIFILGFFLFSAFVICMLQTHYNLKGVHLAFASAAEGFAGEPIALAVTIGHSRARWKRNLRIRTLSKSIPTVLCPDETLAPNEASKMCVIEVIVPERGVHPIPRLGLETTFPLGLFRAWKVFRFTGYLTAYPRPDTRVPLESLSRDSGQEELGLRTAPEGDFGELRPYRLGESYHQIAWKQFARSGDLYSKVHWGADTRHYVIPWRPAGRGRAEAERALERMSGWVKLALDEDASFELSAPWADGESGRGPEQARKCWRQLAEARVGEAA